MFTEENINNLKNEFYPKMKSVASIDRQYRFIINFIEVELMVSPEKDLWKSDDAIQHLLAVVNENLTQLPDKLHHWIPEEPKNITGLTDDEIAIYMWQFIYMFRQI